MNEVTTVADLTLDERAVFVTACELDAQDRVFSPRPEFIPACERLRQLGWLRATSTTEALIFDLTDEARVADRSSRLMETAAEATN